MCIFEEGIWKIVGGKNLEELENRKDLGKIKGQDIAIRGAEVQVFNHKTDREIISRPIQKLYPSEISSNESNTDKNGTDSPTSVSSKEESRIPLVLNFPATYLGGGTSDCC